MPPPLSKSNPCAQPWPPFAFRLDRGIGLDSQSSKAKARPAHSKEVPSYGKEGRMNPQVENLLTSSGFRLERHKKHRIWKHADGRVWTVPSTPSGKQALLN